MKVLIADDSQPIRERLMSRLSRLPDVQVAEAVDTTDAFRQIATFMPDVAVLDIRMPGGGGIKVLSEIKMLRPGIAVIIITSYPYAQYRRKCLEAGADFFFDKTTEFERVAETIGQLTRSDKVSEVARRTTAEQLVAAKEELERVTQRQRDMNILRLLQKSDVKSDSDLAYLMWEKTFDAMPDLTAVFDSDHSIVRVNKAMADRLGIPAAELTGKKCYEYMHGATGPFKGCPHDAMLRDHKEHSAEVYVDCLGGWFQVSVSPIYNEEKLIGAIHIAHDITARKASEHAVAESEKRYHQLFESMQAGFALHEMIYDTAGMPCDYRFLQVNPAFEKLTGLAAEKIIGKTVKEVLPLTEARWIETYGRVVQTGEAVQIDNFSVELGRHYSVSAYSSGEGQFATIISDITEQKNAEEAIRRARDVAEEANRTKTQFLANMSHELRTPLNAIIGFAELLEDSALDAQQRDYIQTINASGESLLRLISDLLDFSKIEMGKIVLHNEPLSIPDVADKAMAMFIQSAADKGVQLTCTIDKHLPKQFVSDPVRLQQVLVNLIGNAIKFTDSGFVKLMVQNRVLPSGSNRVEFLVEDSGTGISPAVMELIFNPFQQGDSSSTREHGGSGLGLAISKNLVEMMGGQVDVESHEGTGSCFRFYIQEPASLADELLVRDVRVNWSGQCVCVWSDDPADMRSAENLLERGGILPRYADTIDAIYGRLTHDEPASAVLCNLDIPGLIDRLPEFRKRCPNIPWIGFSGWNIPLDEKIRGCFSAFVDRPLRAGQLYAALMKITGSGA